MTGNVAPLDDLPADFKANLSDMTDSQLKAIEEDKRRWLKARNMTDSTRPLEIRKWLDSITDADYKIDMARRLNQMRSKGK
jgi:DNA-directed RNA polymerase sigma subunit (sigma70/sigma32)